jgi:protein FrlC
MLDTAGALGTGETVTDYVNALGDRLAHVHMIDSDPAGSHLSWGDGVLSAQAIVSELQGAGYGGALSIEITSPRYYLDPKTAMARSVAALRSVLPEG